MKTHLMAAVAALALATLPAHAALIGDVGAITAPASTIDFEAYDGLLTTGPVLIAPDVVFTGDTGSELGAYVRDLHDNGAWGVGNHFAAGGFVGELRFTFAGLSSGAGAFVNHFAFDALPGLAIVVSAYGQNNEIIESHTVTVDTSFDSYNEGLFVGISRPMADIRSVSFKGVGVVVDDFAYAALAPVPEPETYALLLAGLMAVGYAARRRG